MCTVREIFLTEIAFHRAFCIIRMFLDYGIVRCFQGVCTDEYSVVSCSLSSCCLLLIYKRLFSHKARAYILGNFDLTLFIGYVSLPPSHANIFDEMGAVRRG